MERCWEYFECNQTRCKMYGKKEGPQCWTIRDTQCAPHGMKELMDHFQLSKNEACDTCIYKKEAKDKIPIKTGQSH